MPQRAASPILQDVYPLLQDLRCYIKYFAEIDYSLKYMKWKIKIEFYFDFIRKTKNTKK